MTSIAILSYPIVIFGERYKKPMEWGAYAFNPSAAEVGTGRPPRGLPASLINKFHGGCFLPAFEEKTLCLALPLL